VTGRGAATRTRLIEATSRVVREVGYAHATTRAIAQAAGVAEGTIYRHFPDKATMFMGAVLERNGAVIEWVSRLPARAGQDTVESNLVDSLARLASLRDELLPLELALLADPELARHRRQAASSLAIGRPAGPPEFIAAYLAAEQELGRVRAGVAADEVAVILLATLFGLALQPADEGAGVDRALLVAAVRLLMTGIEPGVEPGSSPAA
jgi:AcrR family transcriptional regulator